MSLTYSHCYSLSLCVSPSSMELLHVNHLLLWLMAVSHCLSQFHSVAACLSFSHMVAGNLSVSLRSHGVPGCL